MWELLESQRPPSLKISVCARENVSFSNPIDNDLQMSFQTNPVIVAEFEFSNTDAHLFEQRFQP